jgi:hypothetical protein
MPKKIEEKTTMIDWSVLLTASIVFGLSLLVGVVAILASYQYYNYMTAWELKQRNDFGGVESQYSRLLETLEVVNNLYLKKFNQLKSDGFLINGTRLTLQEQYLKTSNDLKLILPQLPLFKQASDYNFSDQKRYTIPGHDQESEFKIYKREINLKLGVLHEGDVLKLIETIEFQKLAGIFNLQNCDIKRNRDDIDVKDVSKPYFSANCVLAWYISLIDKSE